MEKYTVVVKGYINFKTYYITDIESYNDCVQIYWKTRNKNKYSTEIYVGGTVTLYYDKDNKLTYYAECNMKKSFVKKLLKIISKNIKQ